MIKIIKSKIFKGPNLHSTEDVLEISVKISNELSGLFLEKLKCINILSKTIFIWELKKEPNSELIAEYLSAFSMACLNEIRGNLEFRKVYQESGLTHIVLEYHKAEITLKALELAIYFLLNADHLTFLEFDKLLKKFWLLCQKFHPDFQAQILIDYAKKNNIPYRRYIEGAKYWQYGSGCNSLVFFESSPITDSSIGVNLSHNKVQSLELFQVYGARTALSALINSEEDLEKQLHAIKFPCVIKPIDSGRSNGVTTNITDISALKKAFKFAKKFTSRPVLMEEYVKGELFRIIIIRGKLWKVICRERPAIIGDGNSSIQTLVDLYNKPIIENLRPGSFVGPVLNDDDYHNALSKQGVSTNSIPKKGQKIIICEIPLLSKGSIYKDVSSAINRETKFVAESFAKNFSIEACGIDFISEDITESCFKIGCFIEINSTPGLRVPLMAGIDKDEIGRVVIGDIPSNIPIILIISPTENHNNLCNIMQKKEGAAWASSASYGIGSIRFQGNNNLENKIENLLKNKCSQSLTVLSSPREIMQKGMLIKPKYSILFNNNYNNQITSDWLKVIKKNSERLVLARNTKDIESVFILI
jgi:cyanophycin synthetase